MKKAAAFLSIAFATFIFLIIVCDYLFAPSKGDNAKLLYDGWDVDYNGEVYEDIALSSLRDKMGHLTQKGDVLTLSTEVSGIDSMEFPTLLFLSRYSAWEVYWDDEFLVSGNLDKLEEGKFIGCKYNFITIPYDDDSGTVMIKLYVNEDNAYSFFETPILGNYFSVRSHYIFSDLFAIGSSILLIIFGAAFLIITLTFYKTLPDIISQLFSSLLFIDLGVWIISYYRLLELFIDTGGHTTEIEYFSLYLMVPLMYTIIGCINKHYTDWIFLVVSLTSTFICTFLVALHISGIAHVNSTLPAYHGVALVCFFFVLAAVIRDAINNKLMPSEKIQLMGLGALSIGYLIHFVLHILSIAGLIGRADNLRKSVPLGALIFVFTTLINYFIYISESYARRREFMSLTHLAYADGLTNLPNRSRYDKYISDLEKTDDNYCIISLDLNGLKQINDNSGHVAGDNYLKDFASVLQQCFDDKGFIARIGGDEFIAILTEENSGDVDSILARLKDALEVKNILYPVFRRSVATGYAFRSEIPGGDSHAVYLLADKRMYENKKIMHEKLGIAARI